MENYARIDLGIQYEDTDTYIVKKDDKFEENLKRLKEIAENSLNEIPDIYPDDFIIQNFQVINMETYFFLVE